jgi:Tol biopolymer transport system component
VPRLSPDGSQVATDISDDTNRGDIWLLDVARGAGTRFTSWPEDDSAPAWSPDGGEVAFFSVRGGTNEAVYARPVRGTAEPRLLIMDPDAGLNPTGWSRDGFLLIDRNMGGNMDIWVHSLRDKSFRPFQAGSFDEYSGTFTPNGRLVAFTSDETEREEVYLTTFPEAGERWRVSTGGGGQPVWRRDGGELYYLAPGSRLMAVPVEGGAAGRTAVAIGTPRLLFRVDIKEHRHPQFDTIDGRRFLVNRNVNTGTSHPLTLVLHPFARAER